MRPVLGLALGGGAARGLAHLGVLDVLASAGLGIDVIAGTSFGSLMGAAVLCRGGDAAAVERDVLAYVGAEAFRRSKLHFLRSRLGEDEAGATYSVREAIRRGVSYAASPRDAQFLPVAEFEAAIEALVPDRLIESLPIRFGTVAADLETGEELLFDSGALRPAVRASCAIPGLLPPVSVSGRLCIDGGWVEKIPVLAARALGADVVIAVDVADELADTKGMLEGPGVIHRADAVQSARFKAMQLAGADAVIRCEVGDFGWADFGRASDIVSAGREAARLAMPVMLERIERARGGVSWLGRIAGAMAARTVRSAPLRVTRLAAQAASPEGRKDP